MGIELIDKIIPKDDAFTGMVDADQVIGLVDFIENTVVDMSIANVYAVDNDTERNNISANVGDIAIVSDSAEAGDEPATYVWDGSTWLKLKTPTNQVSSVFGRTGAVIAQTGDYTTDQVTEGSNLYFTTQRAVDALDSHTGDSTIHFTQGDISISKSQVTGLDFVEIEDVDDSSISPSTLWSSEKVSDELNNLKTDISNFDNVSTQQPDNGQALVFNSVTQRWEPSSISATGDVDLTSVKLLSYDRQINNGESFAEYTIDWNQGNFQSIVLTENCHISFTDPPGPGYYDLLIVQDDVGGHIATFDENVQFRVGEQKSEVSIFNQHKIDSTGIGLITVDDKMSAITEDNIFYDINKNILTISQFETSNTSGVENYEHLEEGNLIRLSTSSHTEFIPDNFMLNIMDMDTSLNDADNIYGSATDEVALFVYNEGGIEATEQKVYVLGRGGAPVGQQNMAANFEMKGGDIIRHTNDEYRIVLLEDGVLKYYHFDFEGAPTEFLELKDSKVLTETHANTRSVKWIDDSSIIYTRGPEPDTDSHLRLMTGITSSSLGTEQNTIFLGASFPSEITVGDKWIFVQRDSGAVDMFYKQDVQNQLSTIERRTALTSGGVGASLNSFIESGGDVYAIYSSDQGSSYLRVRKFDGPNQVESYSQTLGTFLPPGEIRTARQAIIPTAAGIVLVVENRAILFNENLQKVHEIELPFSLLREKNLVLYNRFGAMVSVETTGGHKILSANNFNLNIGDQVFGSYFPDVSTVVIPTDKENFPTSFPGKVGVVVYDDSDLKQIELNTGEIRTLKTAETETIHFEENLYDVLFTENILPVEGVENELFTDILWEEDDAPITFDIQQGTGSMDYGRTMYLSKKVDFTNIEAINVIFKGDGTDWAVHLAVGEKDDPPGTNLAEVTSDTYTGQDTIKSVTLDTENITGEAYIRITPMTSTANTEVYIDRIRKLEESYTDFFNNGPVWAPTITYDGSMVFEYIGIPQYEDAEWSAVTENKISLDGWTKLVCKSTGRNYISFGISAVPDKESGYGSAIEGNKGTTDILEVDITSLTGEEYIMVSGHADIATYLSDRRPKGIVTEVYLEDLVGNKQYIFNWGLSEIPVAENPINPEYADTYKSGKMVCSDSTHTQMFQFGSTAYNNLWSLEFGGGNKVKILNDDLFVSYNEEEVGLYRNIDGEQLFFTTNWGANNIYLLNDNLILLKENSIRVVNLLLNEIFSGEISSSSLKSVTYNDGFYFVLNEEGELFKITEKGRTFTVNSFQNVTPAGAGPQEARQLSFKYDGQAYVDYVNAAFPDTTVGGFRWTVDEEGSLELVIPDE